MRKVLRSFMPGLLALSLMALPWLAGYSDAQTPTPLPGTYSGTLQNATSSATSNGTDLTLNGQVPTVTIQASGTFGSATFTIQGSLDDTNYNTLTCTNMSGSSTLNTAGWLDATGMWMCDTTGINYLRAAINSGTPTSVTIKAQGNSKAFSAYRPGAPGTLTSPSIATSITDANGNTLCTITARTTGGNIVDVLECNVTPFRLNVINASGSHIEFNQASPPTVNGTSTLASEGTDTAGAITAGVNVGLGPLLTFAHAYTNAPICQVHNRTRASAVFASTSTTAMQVMASTTGGWVLSDVLTYQCIGLY